MTVDDLRRHDGLQQLFRELRLKTVWVFGSVSRGDNDEDSDLDLIVDYDLAETSSLEILSLPTAISELLGIPCDVLSLSQIKRSLSSDIRLHRLIAENALHDRILIYEK